MEPRLAPASYTVELRFAPDLLYFLPRRLAAGIVHLTLAEKTSIKDVIESCGVPHPEIDLILCEGLAVGFEHQLTRAASIAVFSTSDSPSEFQRSRLQRRQLTRFVPMVISARLRAICAPLGFDVAYDNVAEDEALARIAATEERALLTRDRRLLMRKIVRDGYCPRSVARDEQTIEVIRRFELFNALAPYTRCVRCNASVHRVEKTEVLQEPEPLTRVYYDEFRRCTGCGNMYWSGSHFDKLEARIARIRAAVRAGT